MKGKTAILEAGLPPNQHVRNMSHQQKIAKIYVTTEYRIAIVSRLIITMGPAVFGLTVQSPIAPRLVEASSRQFANRARAEGQLSRLRRANKFDMGTHFLLKVQVGQELLS